MIDLLLQVASTFLMLLVMYLISEGIVWLMDKFWK